MPRRNENYDKILSKKFENPEYARNYLIHIVNEEGLPIEEALRETIKAMGIKEFARKANLSISAVADFVRGRSKWSTDNLAKHIENVFELQLALTIKLPDDRVA